MFQILLMTCMTVAAKPNLILTKLGAWNGENIKGMQVRVVGDSVAYTAGATKGMGILDVKDPKNPILVGSKLIKSSYSSYATPWLKGKVILSNADHAFSYVLDVSDPTNPLILDSIISTEGPGSVELDVKDSLVYASIYNASKGGLGIYRWTADSRILRTGYLAMDGNVWAASVRDTLVAVSVGTSGVSIVSVKDSSKPVLLAKAPTSGGHAFETVWKGKQIWTVNTSGGIDGYDLSIPSSPKLLASLRLGGSPGRRIAIHGDILFVTLRDSLKVVDISAPTAPSVLGGLPGSLLSGVWATDSTLYVMQETAGLQIYRWRVAPRPTLVAPSGYVRTKKPEFKWRSLSSASEFDFVLSNDSSFSTEKLHLPIADTSLQMPVSIATGKWWWKVASLPDSNWSIPSSFIIVPDSMPIPYFFAGETFSSLPEFRWSAAENITKFSLDISTSQTFSNAISFEVIDTVFSIPVKLGVGSWYWRVCALSVCSPSDSFALVANTSISSNSRANQGAVLAGNGIKLFANGSVSIYSIDGRMIFEDRNARGWVHINLSRYGLNRGKLFVLRNGPVAQVLVRP